MKYAMLIHEKPGYVEALAEDERKAMFADGPYADTKELFAGYYVFEADNLDEAIELAARSRSGRWWSASAAGRGFPGRVGAGPGLACRFPSRFRSR
jgi:hypothetical protein